MVQQQKAGTAIDGQGAQYAVHRQTWNGAWVQFLQQLLDNRSDQHRNPIILPLDITFLSTMRTELRKTGYHTWKSKDCCPVSGSLCFVTEIRNREITSQNGSHMQWNQQCQWQHHCSDLRPCNQFTFVSWSTNFDKLLDLNFNFCWGWLSRSFFGLLGCSASSGGNKTPSIHLSGEF